MARLYNAMEPEDGTVAQFAAVHILRWQQEWGEPRLLFCEVDCETQVLLDAAPALLDACKEALTVLADPDKTYVKSIQEQLRSAIAEAEKN